jgi:methylated-DNA-[protein]-cysteine S-methyltransferase
MIVIKETSIGKIGIEEQGGKITQLIFGKYVKYDFEKYEISDYEKSAFVPPVISEAFLQLEQYFRGERKEFSLPLNPQGTPFMKSVWNALCTIPYGKTATYKEIAETVGRPKACRAVGLANNKNPIAIVIPCHRVIGSSGKLVGYAGGLDLKRRLLILENKSFQEK